MNYYFQCMCALIVLVQLSEQAAIENRIAKGKKVSIEKYPYQALIIKISNIVIDPVRNEIAWESNKCGGSIISKKYILTAAHCVTKNINNEVVNLPTQNISIVVGKSSHSNIGQLLGQKLTLEVNEIKVNPKYKSVIIINTYGKSTNDEHDIALIELKELLKWSSRVKNIQLPKEGAKYPFWGKTLVVTGYGWMYGNKETNDLYAVNMKMPEENLDDCISKGFICALKQINDRGFCRGDSGGPMVLDGVQYGVVSSQARPENLPDLCEMANTFYFTDVILHRRWISQNSDVDEEQDNDYDKNYYDELSKN